MARLQVLYLPSVSDGDRIDARFGIVADQAADLSDDDRAALRAFASELGAQGCVVLSGALDLVQGTADEETAEELGGLLKDMLSVPAIAPQRSEQRKPKLPPPNTTEGKLARTWGSRPPTDGDPR